MRILHLTAQRPDATGSGIYLQAVMTQAAERGCHNALICGIPDGPEPAATHLAQVSHSVRFDTPDLPFPIPGMSDVMPYPSSRYRDLDPEMVRACNRTWEAVIRDICHRFQPDIIHSHHLWMVTAAACRVASVPVVATCHGTDLWQHHLCPHLAEEIAADCRKLSSAMALTEIQKQEIHTTYKIPLSAISVTGAGYDPAVFHPDPETSPHPKRILYAGKLNRAKGVFWLLESLSRLPPDTWELRIAGAGSGEEAQAIRHMAASMPHVTLLGALDRRSLAREMQQASLFVLPSFFEGLPLVLLEAMACGCNTLSTDLPGTRELASRLPESLLSLVHLPHGVPIGRHTPEMTAALTEAIQKSLLLPRDLSCETQSHAVSPWSWPAVFRRVEAVYNEVTGR